MNPNVFEIDPLDLGISRIQFNLSKRIRGVEADVFDVISEKYESRDSTMPLFSIEVNCFPKTEKGGVVLQFIFKTVSGERLERSTLPKSKEEIMQAVENRKFLLFCKQMVVQLLGDEVLDEDIRKEIVNDSTGMEVSTKSGLLIFRGFGEWWKKFTFNLYTDLQEFNNNLRRFLITVRFVGRKYFCLIKFIINWVIRLFHEDTDEEIFYQYLKKQKFSKGKYEVDCKEEKMVVIKQLIGKYWKPRCLMNHQTKCAYPIMDASEYITLFTTADIAWETLYGIPNEARERAKMLDAHFPTFIHRFVNGVAQVSWQINPDGRYYRDEDGFGMTDDEEITLYGFIDRNGKVVVKFRKIEDYGELDELRAYAEKQMLMQ